MVMGKIAIIDDNLFFRKITFHLLKKTGVTEDNILMFENGKEAFEYIIKNIKNKNLLPELILLDLNMPIVTGWKFLSLFRIVNEKHNYNPQIYILTSSVDHKDISRAKSIHEVNGYLIKPIKTNDLNDLLKKSELKINVPE